MILISCDTYANLTVDQKTLLFAPLWDELQKYADKFGAADEHRRDILHLLIPKFL